jgi:hypothetical protein
MMDLSRETPTIISPDPLPDPDWPVPRYKNEQGQWTDIEPYLRAEYAGTVLRYAKRAERIAGGYARLYLEDFEHGDSKRCGRFYWAGLAAFASKQVAFTIQSSLVLFYGPATLSTLGKGNLWLYNDALPWHFAWALCPKSVDMCAAERNALDFEPVVLSNLNKQEWAKEVVPNIPWNFDENSATLGAPIGQLRLAPLMREAIEGWRGFDAETSDKGKAVLAMQHLWAMARHEQGEVLQGFIYEDMPFRASLYTMRTLERHLALSERYLSFKIQLSFSAKGYVEDPAWRSDAPPGIRVENYKQRMQWIRKTASKYHHLMNGEGCPRLLAELRILADHDD